MNEGRTTAVFGVIAAIAVGLAWWSKPESAVSEQTVLRDRVGELVFSGFEDPEAAASLQIIKYDEALAQLKRFEVARDPNTKLWTLPSNDGYPADAAEQVKDATTPLIGLEVLGVASDIAGDHELYGVVNPDDDDLAAGTSGVGMLVTFKDDSDQILASLVIGKEVDQTEGQRYVRIPTEDAVYQVEISTEAFTTDFRDWIEGELLGIRSMDITSVAVRDYSLQQSLAQVLLNKNFDAEVSYDAEAADWQLVNYTSYANGAPEPATLAEDEELNDQFLNDLRTAVQDLEIIDVQRKPTGLASDLKVDDSLLKNEESILNLQQQGFFAAAATGGTEIFAAGGETVVGTEDGVDYLLRFGEATASLSSTDSDEADGGLSRYLLVTAKVNEGRFPQPELESLPETVEEMLAREAAAAAEITPPDAASALGPARPPLPEAETPQAEETPDSTENATGEPSDDSTDEQAPPAAEGSDAGNTESEETSDPPASTETSSSNDIPEDDCGPPQEDEDDAQEEQDTTATEDTPAAATDDSAAQDQPADSDAAQQSDDAAAQTPTEPEATAEELEERLEALREDIARENQRKLDERKDRLDAARTKVLELNAKFSEWYYVVGDGFYKKIKVNRDNLIQNINEANANAAPQIPAGPPSGLNFPGGLDLPQLQP